MIEQPAVPAGAVQLNVVPVLDVLEAVKPVGAPGADVQDVPPPLPGFQSAGVIGGSHPTCDVCA